VLDLAERKLRSRPLQTSSCFTYMPLDIHICALGGVVRSPSAMWGRRWAKNGLQMQLSSPWIDWRWWTDRRRLGRAAVARLRQSTRLDAKSDKVSSNAGQQVTGKARARSRGDARGVERRPEQMVAELAHDDANGVRQSLRACELRQRWLFVVEACIGV
jgi:hypothetical protein